MSEDLLRYYDRELKFLRALGTEFADQHSKVAGRLRLSPEESKDPHVERLLQGVAFLNARVHRRLDDDFPEVGQTLLEVIYPHFLRPIPSLSIFEYQIDRSQKELVNGYHMPKGTMVETEAEEETSIRCQFSSCYPVQLWPIEVAAASLQRRPFAAPLTPGSQVARACIRLQLRCFAKGGFSSLSMDQLRLYLHPGQATNVYRLYEILFNHVQEIAVAAKEDDPNPTILSKDALQPVGFAREEGLLPCDARTFLGYQILTEFFAFPQKYFFVDLKELDQACPKLQDTMEVFFFLDLSDDELQRELTADNIRLGCSPAINLFQQTAASFQLTHDRTEYLIDPNPREIAGHEIYSVDRVEALNSMGDSTQYHPFYSFHHAVERESQTTYYHCLRRRSERDRDNLRKDRGQDMFMTLVDLSFDPRIEPDTTMRIETTCLNRDLPERLPTGPGRPQLKLVDGSGGIVQGIQCLVHPTGVLRAPLDFGLVWQLISHLSLNHLSLTDGEQGAAALSEMLLLHDRRRSTVTKRMIEGITAVHSRPVVRRVGQHAGGFGRGIQIELEFDETNYTGTGAYLFATVLDRFFGLYTSINSFTELVAMARQRRDQEEPWRWPKRTGERVLV